jgi:predicted lipid-binding transport protein (Tim44 family)
MTANDRTKGQQEPEDLDVRKATARLRSAGSAQSRRSIVAVAELLGGVANATADAFQSLNQSMTTELVTKYGLGASVYMGVREGNVRFLEDLSRTSRRVFDALRPPDPNEPEPPAAANGGQALDYERLAKLVAAEMREPEAASG